MRLPRLTTWLLGSLCLVAGAGCHKTTDADPDAVEVSFAHTQCADPWGLTTTNQQLRDAAYDYVKAKGLTAFPLTVSTTSQTTVCTSCSCPTGVLLTGTARRVDLPALQVIGFVQR